MPHVDAIKIEGRSKSELYVGSIVKAYKHVRDAIIAGTPIDENIKNLVNVVPHRQYRSGFVFNKLADYPE
jgi:putative protease